MCKKGGCGFLARSSGQGFEDLYTKVWFLKIIKTFSTYISYILNVYIRTHFFNTAIVQCLRLLVSYTKFKPNRKIRELVSNQN